MDKSYKPLNLPVDLHAMLKGLASQRRTTMIRLMRQLVEKEMSS